MNTQEVIKFRKEAIHISPPNQNPPKTLYFLISNRRVNVGEVTKINTACNTPLCVGQKIIVENLFGVVDSIKNERPTKNNKIFQEVEMKLIYKN